MNDGRKKKPQKHQNKTAFKIQFDSLAIQHQKKVSLSLLCKRCTEQMNWKLQFNKYKKITQPSKCNFCHEKVVVRSYMKCCDPCAEKEGVCPKCLDKDAQVLDGDEVKLSQKEKIQKDRQQEKTMNQFVDSLRQRSKRKVKRQYEKGLITWDKQHKLFRDQQGNEVVGLKFKTKGLDDLQKQFQQQNNDEDADQNSNASEEDAIGQEYLKLKQKGKKQKQNKQKVEQSKGEGPSYKQGKSNEGQQDERQQSEKMQRQDRLNGSSSQQDLKLESVRVQRQDSLSGGHSQQDQQLGQERMQRRDSGGYTQQRQQLGQGRMQRQDSGGYSQQRYDQDNQADFSEP